MIYFHLTVFRQSIVICIECNRILIQQTSSRPDVSTKYELTTVEWQYLFNIAVKTRKTILVIHVISVKQTDWTATPELQYTMFT
jgi:hypothetical protein